VLVTAEDERIDEAAQSLEATGAKVESMRSDLATYEGVEALYERIRSAGRPVEAIAINAGVGGDFTQQTDLRDELNLINLNVTSTVHLAKRVLPDMRARGRGRVLFTSSIAAQTPAPFEAVYAASKAFVYNFAESLRNELKETGVTVTALLPGPTETKFFHRAGMDDTKVGAGEQRQMEALERFELDLLVGGVTDQTPWSKYVGLTGPYFEETYAVGFPGSPPPPKNLKGVEVTVREGDPAAYYLTKEGAAAVRVIKLEPVNGPVAAPT
jgi:NADP-dependent 3-hydroxy acid dehydrogenase YdfG